jgi:hypothetical protein
VIPLANNPEKCNVIVFRNHVALFKDRIGALRVAEKTTPKQYRNYYMFHIGLYRREAKYKNCRRALYSRYKKQIRYRVYHRGHKSADLKYPLRPKK